MDSQPQSNPYQPSDSDFISESVERRVIHSPLVLSIQWTVVVLFNVIVPLMLSWSMTQGVGHFGVGLGVLLILLLGYWASVGMPLFVLFTIRGGVLVALSQFFPVLHLIAGLLAVSFYRYSGIIPAESLDRTGVGLMGAFLLTATTGVILMSFCLVVGFFIRLITPDRWWLAKKRADE